METRMTPSVSVMLLIDADNVSADVVEQAFNKVMAERGAIHVRRAYCTVATAVKHLPLFKRLSIRPMVNLSTGKNSTDIALAVDAIDLVVAQRFDVVVIVSSDSDFAPLVVRLREKGCRVEGIGQEGNTSDNAKLVYDDFVVLAHGKAHAAAKAAPKPTAKRASKKKAAGVPEPEPAIPPLPKGVQDILAVVPQLLGGDWVELGLAADPLRKAKLLGKAASPSKFFKKYPAQFALQSEKQPHQVRFIGNVGS
ncbi:MAG: NYN domain-containing protein [Myxococcota bacterium]|jgi:uncharacterized protein (TIGR00288 family)|nr:NYN domain-containing protein [Myxococcota bacterium]